MREWLVPVTLGLLAGTAAYLLAPESEETDGFPHVFVWQEPPRGPCLVMHFAPPQDRHDCGRQVPVILAGRATPRPVDGWLPDPATIAWHGAVGLLPQLGRPVANACDPPCAGADDEGPTILLPGGAGTNGTFRATIFVFDLDGEVLASNAPAEHLGLFRQDADFYTDIGNHTWSLADDPPPSNVRPPEPFLTLARAKMEGLPVGGIATALIEDHPYASLIGPVVVTARVDAVDTATP